MEQQKQKQPSSNIAIKSALGVTTCMILVSIVLFAYGSFKNYIKNQNIIEYKDANAVFLKAINTSQADNGKLNSWDYSEEQTPENFTKKYLIPYLQISKDCGTNKGQGCFAKNTDYKYLNGTPSGLILDNSDGYKFIHKDGMSFLVEYNPFCTINKQYCFQVYADVNGPKKGPSQFGRDLFVFNAYPFTNEFKPYGTYSNEVNTYDPYKMHWSRYPKTSDCIEGGEGLTCGTRLIMDGYEMHY